MPATTTTKKKSPSVAVRRTDVPGVRAARRSIASLEVDFEITTKDGLRRVNFGLTKKATATGSDWTIRFVLSERAKKSDEFAEVVTLNVKVSLKNEEKAQKMATGGMTPGQAAFAAGPAAAAVKAAEAGEIDPADRDAAVEAVVTKK